MTPHDGLAVLLREAFPDLLGSLCVTGGCRRGQARRGGGEGAVHQRGGIVALAIAFEFQRAGSDGGHLDFGGAFLQRAAARRGLRFLS